MMDREQGDGHDCTLFCLDWKNADGKREFEELELDRLLQVHIGHELEFDAVRDANGRPIVFVVDEVAWRVFEDDYVRLWVGCHEVPADKD